MSGEIESQAETESEDGGVTLSTAESSDELRMERYSAPTSASQSPIQPASSLSSSSATAHSSLSMDAIEQALPVASESDAISLANDSYMLSLVDSDLHDTVAEPGIGGVPGLLQWGSQSPTDYDAQTGEPNAGSSEAPGDSAQSLSLPMTAESFPGAATYPEVHPHHDLPEDLTGHNDDFTGNNSPLPLEATHQNWNSQLDAATDNFLQSIPAFTLPNDDSYIDWPEDLSDYWDDTEESIRNFHSEAFFSFWKVSYAKRRPGFPGISALGHNVEKVRRPDIISAEEVDPGDPAAPDLQGIHWSRFQTTKEDAREVRRMTYSNHINEVPDVPYSARLISNQGVFGTPDYKMKFSDEAFPDSDRHFDFREINTRFKSYISHFQLRHTLFASSKNALFYIHKPHRGYGYGAWYEPGFKIDAKISCFNPQTSADECVMDLSKRVVESDPARTYFRPSTLNAGNGVLTVGSFEGSYAIKSLATSFETRPTLGVVTDNGIEGSTNHIQNFLDRISGLPQAAFSSNNKTIRILDCTTNKFVKVHHFPYLVNCSAISPDGRLRLLVGDDCYPIVANADTGEVITKLNGHTNYGFACDWAPNGVTMATGHQDGFVNIWDARHLSQPIHTIPMEQAGSRTLQFSPLGSGKRLLVIAEPGDFVHVVDARTFQSKQTIEFFGDIAGISMTPDGSALYIANQDHKYGGLMEFERSFNGLHEGSRPPERLFNRRRSMEGKVLRRRFFDEFDYGTPDSIGRLDRESWIRRRELTFDWLEEGEMDDDDPRILVPRVRRQRRGVDARDLES